MQQAQVRSATVSPARWWPEAPSISAVRAARTTKTIQQTTMPDPGTDDLRAMFDAQVVGTGDAADDWLDAVARNAFWQAVDAIRAHRDWSPDVSEDLFGEVRAIDGRLITELAWIFGAEGDAPLPFEAAADAMSLNPNRFRRACQRAFPEECAWIEANVGPLQGV